MVRTAGSYLPQVHEEVVQIQTPHILDNKKALHVVATRNFRDVYDIERKAGEEYLITLERSSSHILDIYEQF